MDTVDAHSRNQRFLSRAVEFVVVLAIIVNCSWYLLPLWERGRLTEDEITILSYGGYGGSVDLPIWAFWVFLASTLGLLLAVLIWRESMRYLILVFFGLSIFVLVPLGGMVIETGMSMMLRDFGNLTLGALIAILFARQGSTAN